MNERQDELIRACHIYLTNCRDNQDTADQAARQMYEILKEKFEQPPTLGVTVTEKIVTKDSLG